MSDPYRKIFFAKISFIILIATMFIKLNRNYKRILNTVSSKYCEITKLQDCESKLQYLPDRIGSIFRFFFLNNYLTLILYIILILSSFIWLLSSVDSSIGVSRQVF